jgi:hypothetical protein
VTDAFELEVRQVAGVSFVAFAERGGVTVVELLINHQADQGRVRSEAARAAANHFEGPVEIQLRVTPAPRTALGPVRVQLALVIAVDGGGSVEVHLARGSHTSITRGVAGDTLSVGTAALEGLRNLGLNVPYDMVAVQALAPEVGAGVLAVLRDRVSGELRRGVGSGHGPAEAVARAVLSALNRHLQSSLPGPPRPVAH